jgi:hypothetical protein
MGNYIKITFYPEGSFVIMKKTTFEHIKKLAASTDGEIEIEYKNIDKDNKNILFQRLYVDGAYGTFKNLYNAKTFNMLKKSIKGILYIDYEDVDAPEEYNKKIKGILK